MRATAFATALLAAAFLPHHAFAQRDIMLQRQKSSGKSELRGTLTKPAPHPNSRIRTAGEQKAEAANKARDSFTLTVGGITGGQPIPPRFAFCRPDGRGSVRDGANINPAISWSPPPPGTRSLVLLVVDKDVPATFDKANVPEQVIGENEPRQDFYHWVLVDIPPTVGGLLQGADSSGITPGGKPYGTTPYGMNGRNDYAILSEGPHGGYDGPCPPWNDQRLHHYHFTLYALDIPGLGLPAPVTGRQAEVAIRGHILARSEVVGTFTTHADRFRRERRARNAKRNEPPRKESGLQQIRPSRHNQ